MKRISKTLILLLVTVLFLSAFPEKAHADMGPKPSINLKVINAPKDYYIALITDEFERDMPETELKLDQVTEESVKEYLQNFYYQGWYFFESPVGYNVYKSNDEGIYLFDYMVPYHFKVVIITEDGIVHLSEAVDKKEFNAEFTYDFAADKLTEHVAEKVTKRILYILLCYIMTLAIELFVLKLFDYPFNKKNIISFLVVNTITQLSLNIMIAKTGGGLALLFLGIIAEFFIIVVEGIAFGCTLVDKDGQESFGKGFLYSIAANVLSVFVGICIIWIYSMIVGAIK